MPSVGGVPYVVLMPNDEHLTTAQVAEEFGVDVRTVHRWTADDADPRLDFLLKTPGKRGAYIFTREEVERFANHRPKVTSEPADVA